MNETVAGMAIVARDRVRGDYPMCACDGPSCERNMHLRMR